MKVKYTGNPRDPGDTKVAELFDMTFFLGKEEDVSHLDATQRRKLAGNPCFTVTEPDSETEQKRKPGRPRKDEVSDGNVLEVQ